MSGLYLCFFFCLMCLQVTDRDECVHVVVVWRVKVLLTGRGLITLMVGTPCPQVALYGFILI